MTTVSRKSYTGALVSIDAAGHSMRRAACRLCGGLRSWWTSANAPPIPNLQTAGEYLDHLCRSLDRGRLAEADILTLDQAVEISSTRLWPRRLDGIAQSARERT